MQMVMRRSGCAFATGDRAGGGLPTNLTGPEIAGELYVSSNTVKTHLRTLYAKLGTHHRSETVARARDLGLLAPLARSAR